jgi:ATP-dependent Clp protease ATP-binding subunit ClpA
MTGSPVEHSKELVAVLRTARIAAQNEGSSEISTRHLLIALISNDFHRVIDDANVNLQRVASEMTRLREDLARAVQEAEECRLDTEEASHRNLEISNNELLERRVKSLERSNYLCQKISTEQFKEAELQKQLHELKATRQFEIAYLLQFAGLSAASARYVIEKSEGDEPGQKFQFSVSAVNALFTAGTQVIKYEHDKLLPIHLLWALAVNDDSNDEAIRLLKDLRVDSLTLSRKVDAYLKLSLGYGLRIGEPKELEVTTVDKREFEARETEYAERRPPSARRRSGAGITDWFEPEAMELVYAAQELARNSGVVTIGVPHILWAMLAESNTPASSAVERVIDVQELKRRLLEEGEHPQVSSDPAIFTEQLQKALEFAWRSAHSKEKISIEHIISGTIDFIIKNDDLALLSLRLRSANETMRWAALDVVRAFFNVKEVPPTTEQPEATIAEPGQSVLVTNRVLRVLHIALHEATMAEHDQVYPAHVVLGLLNEAERSEVEFVNSRAVEFDSMRAQLIDMLESCKSNLTSRSGHVVFGEQVSQLLARAWQIAQNYRGKAIDINHLALSFLDLHDQQIKDILRQQWSFSEVALRRRLQWCILWQQQRQLPMLIESILLADIAASFPVLNPVQTNERQTFLLRRLGSASISLLSRAERESRRLHQQFVGIEHIVLAVLREDFGPMTQIFYEEQLLSPDDLNRLEQNLPRGNARTAQGRALSRNAVRIIEESWLLAQRHKQRLIQPEHIVLAIANQDCGLASLIFDSLNIDSTALRESLLALLANGEQCDAS